MDGIVKGLYLGDLGSVLNSGKSDLTLYAVQIIESSQKSHMGFPDQLRRNGFILCSQRQHLKQSNQANTLHKEI